MNQPRLLLSNFHRDQKFNWEVNEKEAAFDPDEIKARLLDLDHPCYIIQNSSTLGVSQKLFNKNREIGNSATPLAYAPPFTPGTLGDPDFKTDHGVSFCYYSGAMANGIASEAMVIAMGQAGFLASFGAGGLVPRRVEEAILTIQKALPNGPYAFNLIHSPNEPAIESSVVDLYLKYGIRCVEAAAFISLTPNIVRYRVSGLSEAGDGTITMANKVIAKISRNEVASRFLNPPPEKIVHELLLKGQITKEQARLAARVPMADDITAEADSGGHTDNRPLVSLLSAIISLRDSIQEKQNYAKPIRVGAAGGIGTPDAAIAAFAMGAAYVVTGSVNQSCVEAGASDHTKDLLAQADMADVAMAPASDMFEMGVKLQVLKRGTFFPMRAQKLYEIYTAFGSIEAIPKPEREKLEKQIFQQSLDSVWEETIRFFEERDPGQIKKAQDNPKKKMALIFRWYLGLASRWSNIGDPKRKLDYQIWCGPAMGAFNAWTAGTCLGAVEDRNVVAVALNIMTGAAYLGRLMGLKSQGIRIPSQYARFVPKRF